MDKEQKKRKQTARLILTETLMVIAVVIMVVILLFIAMGYKVNLSSSNWGLEQSGLVQVDSIPTGAQVTIDGDVLFYRTNMSKMLTEGEHDVILTKDGYELWTGKISIKSGVLYKLDYPRLFLQDRITENVADFDGGLEFLSASPNRNALLYQKKGDSGWQIMNIGSDNVVINALDIRKLIRGEVTGFSNMLWNHSGEKVLVEYQNENYHDFVLIDTKKIEASVNLTEKLGMNFSEIKFASDSAERLIGLENGNLRKITIGSEEVSSVLASGVEEFGNNGMDIVYKNDKGEIGIYREGEKVNLIIGNMDEKNTQITVSEYLGNKYIGLAKDNEFYVYSGNNFPKKDLGDMNTVFHSTLEFVPEKAYIWSNGRFIILENGKNLAIFNAELNTISQFSLENEHYNWLDGFLIGSVNDGNLVVRDFDGSNYRVLSPATDGYDSVITENNKWLYYVSDDGKSLKRDQL